MLIHTFRSHLNSAERQQFRTLVIKDTVALASIFLITVLLAVATYFLFQSYTTHRKELADRWFARGQKALGADQPLVAIDDLRSALLYAPGQRQIEVTLASALASAGKIQEATAYFNTLWEAEPGNGQINVQLARLSARSGNEEQAKRYYHAAIYGNWEGDGYLRRRDTRLELVRYLISRGRFDQARSELLVAAGNAPASDLQVQSLIAGLLLEDHSPNDALAIYQQLLSHAPNDPQALQNAAQTAYDLGDYLLAQHYLLKVVNLPAANDNASDAQKQVNDDLLRKVDRIMVLDPSANLTPAMLAARLLGDREIARKRYEACLSPETADGTGQGGQAVAALPPQAAGVAQAWAAEPKHLTAAALADDPDLQQKERRLIYDTEKLTAGICGAPTGDDAILLRLAHVPSSTSGEVPDHE
jgi:tetratricopeptide (TPR) repeat protein